MNFLLSEVELSRKPRLSFSWSEKPVPVPYHRPRDPERRKRYCNFYSTEIGLLSGSRVFKHGPCGIFQGPDPCPSCRASRKREIRLDLSLAKEIFYFYVLAPSKTEWDTLTKYWKRHNILFKWCYQGENLLRLVFLSGFDERIGKRGATRASSLNSVSLDMISLDTIMNQMPLGSSFHGTLRASRGGRGKPEDEQTEDVPPVPKEAIPIEVFYVKASPGVEDEAWDAAMEKSLDLNPKTRQELIQGVRRRCAIYKAELIARNAVISYSRWEKRYVQIALLDWESYNSIWTAAHERAFSFALPSRAYVN